MVMALSLFYHLGTLVLVAAYENGLAVVAALSSEDTWKVTYRAKVHSQPILSLDVSRGKDYFFTSSADALIAKHPIPFVAQDKPQLPATISSSARDQAQPEKPPGGATTSLLSAALASQPRPVQLRAKDTVQIQTEALKVVNTKHSGQQSLKIRSDSRIFATAGWDSKIRVYSVKTMKEVAVLKWHQVGCYTVAFSGLEENDGESSVASQPPNSQGASSSNSTVPVIPRLVDISVREKRITHAKTAHWLAAGSKDGKISLWDVF
jgi:WD40 repeat protein